MKGVPESLRVAHASCYLIPPVAAVLNCCQFVARLLLDRKGYKSK